VLSVNPTIILEMAIAVSNGSESQVPWITKEVIDKAFLCLLNGTRIFRERDSHYLFHRLVFPRRLKIPPLTLSQQFGGGSHEVSQMPD
jgi:hypothetical protein